MIQEWQIPEEKLPTGPKPKPDPWITYPDGRQECLETAAGKREYRWRTEVMWQRQGEMCAMGHPMRVEEASFDHEAGRGHGGGHRDDRIEVDGQWKNAAVCVVHNGLKGSKRYKWQEGNYLPTKKVA